MSVSLADMSGGPLNLYSSRRSRLILRVSKEMLGLIVDGIAIVMKTTKHTPRPVTTDKGQPHDLEELAAFLLHEIELEQPELRPVRKDTGFDTMQHALKKVNLI